MKRIIVDIDKSLHEKLKILAGIKRVTIQKLADRAIKEYLEERFKPAILSTLKEDQIEMQSNLR